MNRGKPQRASAASLRTLCAADLAAEFVSELRALRGRHILWGRVEVEAPALALVLSEFRRRLYEQAEEGDRRSLALVTAPLVNLPRQRDRRPLRPGRASAVGTSVPAGPRQAA